MCISYFADLDQDSWIQSQWMSELSVLYNILYSALHIVEA